MAFDKTKDVVLAEMTVPNPGKPELTFSLHQYNEGDKKLQIGPRMYKDSDGELRYMKAGRISKEEAGMLAKFIIDLKKNHWK